MSWPIPEAWQQKLPLALVAGDGVFADTLARVLGAARLERAHLLTGPEPGEHGEYPRVFEELREIFLVTADGAPAAETLRDHRAVWDWVRKLSSAAEQHELAFLFVVPQEAPGDFELAIAAGLGAARLDPAAVGHALWRFPQPLPGLRRLAANTRPMDLVALRGRQTADARHAALAGLRAALAGESPAAIVRAAGEVLGAFDGCDYQFDLFCRNPYHRHGSLLRQRLDALVTGSVTPGSHAEIAREIGACLL